VPRGRELARRAAQVSGGADLTHKLTRFAERSEAVVKQVSFSQPNPNAEKQTSPALTGLA